MQMLAEQLRPVVDTVTQTSGVSDGATKTDANQTSNRDSLGGGGGLDLGIIKFGAKSHLEMASQQVSTLGRTLGMTFSVDKQSQTATLTAVRVYGLSTGSDKQNIQQYRRVAVRVSRNARMYEARHIPQWFTAELVEEQLNRLKGALSKKREKPTPNLRALEPGVQILAMTPGYGGGPSIKMFIWWEFSNLPVDAKYDITCEINGVLYEKLRIGRERILGREDRSGIPIGIEGDQFGFDRPRPQPPYRHICRFVLSASTGLDPLVKLLKPRGNELRVTVDANRDITESDEEDNVIVTEFDVR
jgi:hypothetical protein